MSQNLKEWAFKENPSLIADDPSTEKVTLITPTLSIAEQLSIPFQLSKIHWRVGARSKDKSRGIALAYVDARDVMYRLDKVLGPFNWQCKYSHVGPQGVICDLGILHNGSWIWRANGAGETQVEAEKGSMSDAFKRAAVLFGIARYLYALPNTWVPLSDNGYELATTPALPHWATPEGYTEILIKRGEK